MAEDMYQYLEEKQDANLDHLRYSVLALGDSDYDNFCQAGKDFDRMLEELGAKKIAGRMDCDEYYWQDAESWIANICAIIQQEENKPLLSV